jgi:prepilin-type N-terminal cleavage/methylation domain-containing protein
MFKKRLFCFWKIFKNRRGFTLTEVVVTLSILGIMAAISVPSYYSWLPRHRLQTSARQIYDDMNLAKIRAVKDNTVVCITYSAGNDNYTIFLDPDGSSSWTAGDTMIKSNVSLENAVDITAANTCGFNNRGLRTTAQTQVVRLTNPTGIIMRIDVNTAGGISVLMSKDGGATWT